MSYHGNVVTIITIGGISINNCSDVAMVISCDPSE